MINILFIVLRYQLKTNPERLLKKLIVHVQSLKKELVCVHFFVITFTFFEKINVIV